MFNQYGYKMLRDILAEERELDIYPDKLNTVRKYERVQDFKASQDQPTKQTKHLDNKKRAGVSSV